MRDGEMPLTYGLDALELNLQRLKHIEAMARAAMVFDFEDAATLLELKRALEAE